MATPDRLAYFSAKNMMSSEDWAMDRAELDARMQAALDEANAERMRVAVQSLRTATAPWAPRPPLPSAALPAFGIGASRNVEETVVDEPMTRLSLAK